MQITDALVSRDTLFDSLMNFLETDRPLNPLQGSFYGKVVALLISRKGELVWHCWCCVRKVAFQFSLCSVLFFWGMIDIWLCMAVIDAFNLMIRWSTPALCCAGSRVYQISRTVSWPYFTPSRHFGDHGPVAEARDKHGADRMQDQLCTGLCLVTVCRVN